MLRCVLGPGEARGSLGMTTSDIEMNHNKLNPQLESCG